MAWVYDPDSQDYTYQDAQDDEGGLASSSFMDNMFQEQQDRNRNSQVATLDKTVGYQPEDMMKAVGRVVGGLKGYGQTLANMTELQNQPPAEQQRQWRIRSQIQADEQARQAAESAGTTNPFVPARNIANHLFNPLQAMQDISDAPDVPYWSDFARDTLKPDVQQGGNLLRPPTEVFGHNVPGAGDLLSGLIPVNSAEVALTGAGFAGELKNAPGAVGRGLRGYGQKQLESGLGQRSALPAEMAAETRFRNPLEVPPEGSTPYYTGIYPEDRAAIEANGLRPGTALTPDRDIAEAYAQRRAEMMGGEPATLQFNMRPEDVEANSYYYTSPKVQYPNELSMVGGGSNPVNPDDIAFGRSVRQPGEVPSGMQSGDYVEKPQYRAVAPLDLREAKRSLVQAEDVLNYHQNAGSPPDVIQEVRARVYKANSQVKWVEEQLGRQQGMGPSMVGGGANIPENLDFATARAALKGLGYDADNMTRADIEHLIQDINAGKVSELPQGPREVPPVEPPTEPPVPAAAGGAGQPPIKPPSNPRFQPSEGYVPPERPQPGYGVEPPVLTDEERQAVIDEFRQSVSQPSKPVPQSKADVVRIAQEEKYLRGEGVAPIEQIDESQSFIGKSLRELGGVLGIPQTVMTSFDESAVLRQGLPLGIADPATYKKAVEGGLKAFVSTDAAKASEQIVHSSPWYNFLKDYGTKEFGWGPGVAADDRVAGFTGLNKSNVSNMVGKIPGIGNSERAFATILNLEGFGTGEKIAQDMWTRGVRDPAMYRDLADVLNAPRGYSRGKIADVLSASNLAFSGRFMKSRADLILNPFIKKGSLLEPSARQLAAKELVGLAASNAALAGFFGLTGAAAGGAWSVNSDPTSSDFGMLRVGKTRFDTMAGMAPLIRVLIREPVAIKNGEWDKVTPELTRFFANKGSPVVSLLRDIMVNQDPRLKHYLGSGSGLSAKEFALRFAPMLGQDILSAFEGAGGGVKGAAIGAATGVADFFGAGTNTYNDTKQQSGFSSGSPQPWEGGSSPAPKSSGTKQPWE